MTWPWITLLLLGAWHGVNPGMGWLFAVSRGLQERRGSAVVGALPPIALGHALSIGLVALAVMALGVAIDPGFFRIVAGVMLLGWAVYHGLYGHKHRVRIGMTAGFAGLALWSFLMATAHGAGLMLVPALIPLCGAAPSLGAAPLAISLAATGVHAAAMLLVTGTIALLVYEFLGLEVLRRGWINFDLIWSFMLVATGALLIAL